ncbi:hypothetical protein AB0D97_14105 [Streptomyces roseus]|uniref:hypothetical protein n=1 Tax=Streptomyces roseus TaxID=66430 RepID=UPI0034115298
MDYTEEEGRVSPAVSSALEALLDEVTSLKDGLQNLREVVALRPSGTSMSRIDALKTAREHVEAMSTNARGYQDGVSLSNKVSAVDTFARFLMGESE